MHPRTAPGGSLKHSQGGNGKGAGGGGGWMKGAGGGRVGGGTAPQGTSQRPGRPPTVQTLPVSPRSPRSSQSHRCASSWFLQFVDPAAEKERVRERAVTAETKPECLPAPQAQTLAKSSGRWNWGLILTSVLQRLHAPGPSCPLVKDSPHSGKEVGCALRRIHLSPLIHS